MALRAGYKGFKKLLPGLKILRPGTLGIDNDVLIPELNKKFFPRSEQAVLGAKNLLPPITSGTTMGLTFATDSNGVTTITGTSTINSVKYIVTALTNTPAMILSGANGGSTNTIYLEAVIRPLGGGDPISVLDDVGSGIYIRPLASNEQLDIRVGFQEDVTVNVIFKPMLRLASDPDSSYVPYVMTNKELSEVKEGTITGTLTGATIESDSKYRAIGQVCWAHFKIKLSEALATNERISITSINIPKNMMGTLIFTPTFNISDGIAWLNEYNDVVFLNTGGSISANTEIQFTFCYPLI